MKKLIGILGPTASGKTHLAAALAYELDAEIISLDARQVYKELNIGAGKDLNEYQLNGKQIPYHLIDVCSIKEEYHVHQFKTDFLKVYAELNIQGKQAVAVGGTGLYFDVLLNDRPYTSVPVDEQLREKYSDYNKDVLVDVLKSYTPIQNLNVDISSKKRIIRAIEIHEYVQNHDFKAKESTALDMILFGLTMDSSKRNERIDARLLSRLNAGMIDEVSSLLSKGYSADRLVYLGLEYKFITEYLLGKYNKEELIERLKIAIHQFAKRQMTFFRKIEKDGHQIIWLNALSPLQENIDHILKRINNPA